MDEKTAKELNDAFDEFCQKIGAHSALAYFAVDDNVALALHKCIGCRNYECSCKSCSPFGIKK